MATELVQNFHTLRCLINPPHLHPSIWLAEAPPQMFPSRADVYILFMTLSGLISVLRVVCNSSCKMNEAAAAARWQPGHSKGATRPHPLTSSPVKSVILWTPDWSEADERESWLQQSSEVRSSLSDAFDLGLPKSLVRET